MVFVQNLLNVVPDSLRWRHLIQKYSLDKSTIGFVCPHGIGDTYYLLSLLGSFQKLNPGKKIVVLTKPSHRGLISLFHFRNVTFHSVPLPRTPFYLFRRWLLGRPNIEPGNYYLANPFFNHSNTTIDSFGATGITMSEVYKSMLSLDLSTIPSTPSLTPRTKKIAIQRFKKLSLNPSKTIIIAPEANSIPEFSIEFWNGIVHTINRIGYQSVVIGNRFSFPSLPNIIFDVSKPIQTHQLLHFFNLAHGCVSLRSGLCDLTVSSRCKKAIIYPDIKYQVGSFHSRYSLTKKSGDNNIDEYVLDPRSANVATTQTKLLKKLVLPFVQ